MGKKRENAVMKKFFAMFLFFPLSLFAAIETFTVDDIEFACRLPKNLGYNSRIMVLFGGRNWKGEKAIRMFKFDELADKDSLILISPSFKDNEYWEPEKWSGKVLKSAVKTIEKKYRLKPKKLLFYGYSAGGQCSNLFYNYMPRQVEAWGLHACGVYPINPVKRGVRAFITCGAKDDIRVRISKDFIYRYRERGGKLIWKEYQGGHELNKEALQLAHQFFDDVLSDRNKTLYVGEDDTMRILSPEKASQIDVEFRNFLTSEALKTLWEAH